MSTRTASQSGQTELSTRNWPISGWLSIPKSLVLPPHIRQGGPSNSSVVEISMSSIGSFCINTTWWSSNSLEILKILT